ncbi:MAG: acetoacetate decarboxylase family protein [Spirochaetes bacterium]|nr:acetoacetate decarboxylase family protein [Spirochaetota bacterium]
MKTLPKEHFFTIPTETFKMSKGTVELPIYYYDYGYAHFIFFVNYDAAKAKLADTAFVPCKVFGKAITLLNFFEYRETAIGPYNEVGLSILCYPKKSTQPFFVPMHILQDAKKWKVGAYVINLPVTTEIAYLAGKEVWNYPKFVTRIDFSLLKRSFCGIVYDPDLNEPLVTVEGTIGVLSTPRLKNASFISHTTHKGTALRTLTVVDTRYKIAAGFSGRCAVNTKSTHLMAKNLMDLGMNGKKPIGCMYSPQAQMMLCKGEPLSS